MLSLAGKLPRWFVLTLPAGVGISLLFLPALVNLGRYEFVAGHVGVAVLIFSFLAATIDRWAKSELLQDAVKATLGAVLREEFRSELHRIMGYEFLCEHHDMEILINEIDNDHVRVTSTVERHLRNISSTQKELQAMIHLDEWGIAGTKSTIEECYIVNPSGEKTNFITPTFPNAYSLRGETKKILIAPQDIAVLFTKASDIRGKNDHALGVFMSPTKNPVVRVNIPDSLCHEFDFGRTLGPDERVTRSADARTYRLIGMYFPQANMKIRWWPKGWSAAEHSKNHSSDLCHVHDRSET